jgi:hypothetical protein
MANRRFIDFPIAASVGNNDIVLIWQDGLNKQTTKATLFAGSPNSLAGLTDVDISALANGQILQYNSTTSKWENVDRTDIDLDQLGDVTIVSPTNGQVLVYNSSTSKWENSSGGFVPYTGAVTTVNLGAQSILAGSFVKAGGTSAQFLKANGSVDSTAYGTGSVTSVALTMPSAFSVAGSPITTAGTLAVTATGTTAQYIRGDGSLATFPSLTGFVPYTGATADVNLGTHDLTAERGTFQNNGSSDTLTVNHTSGSGYGIIVTKGGNNEALYVSKTSGSGNAMTVIGGRTSLVDLALSSVTNTAGDFLTLSGGVVHKRTAAEVRTDIGAGTVTSVAALTLGTSGTDLSSTVANGTTTPVITLNVPTASATNRGALSSADWSMFNAKENAITAGTTAQYFRGDKTFQTLNTSVVPEGTNLYFTNARSRQAISLTTSGTSGAATYDNSTGVFNIPNYGSALSAYLPLVGGTMTGNINWAQTERGLTWGFNTDGASIKFYNSSDGDTNSRLEFATLDNNNEYFRWVHIPDGGSAYESMRLVPISSGNAELIVTGKIIKSGGTSSQFLKADGSVDSTTYVSNVTASSPLFSSGGATPNITIQQSSGSQNGFLSSTDWTTFNSKQNALTNPVTGTGTTNYLPKFTGSTTIGNSQIIDNGTQVGVGQNPNASYGTFQIKAPAGVYSLDLVGRTAGLNGESQITFWNAAQSSALAYLTNTASNLYIGTGANQPFTLTSGGNFIFGSTTDAGFKLDVNGTGRFSGALTATNATFTRANDSGTILRLENTGGNGFDFSRSQSTGALLIQGSQTGFNNICLAPTSGNVLIGTTTDNGSRLRVNGSIALPHTTKSANYTLDGTDYTVGFDCASNRTATLPDATTCAGRIYVIYQYNTNVGVRYVTLDGNGSQTINGLTTVSLQYNSDYSSVMIQSNGSNWVIISDAVYPSPT